MKYLIRFALLACTLVVGLSAARLAAAGSRPDSPGLRLQPCALLHGPARPQVDYPQHLELQLTAGTRNAMPVPSEDADDVLGVLVLKPSTKARFLVGVEDFEAARWRWLRSSISDVSKAQRDYSFSGWFSTACLAAGAVTLAWQTGSVGGLKVAAKTWRGGGVLGIRAAF